MFELRTSNRVIRLNYVPRSWNMVESRNRKQERFCNDRLIFIMEIPLPGKTAFILRQGPGYTLSRCWYIDTLRPTFAYDISKCISLKTNVFWFQCHWFVSRDIIANKSALVQIISRCQTDDKPLTEAMIAMPISVGQYGVFIIIILF